MSNEFLGERRRGLEEAYFAKHNRELIARLRAESARRRNAAPSADADLPVPRAAVAVPAQAVISVRPIRPEDSARYRAFLETIEAADLRFRFGPSFEGMSAAEISRMSRVDHERETVFVATAQLQPGGAEIVGEVRARADEYGERAEFAILVRSDFQRSGIGQSLLEKLIGHSRTQGVRLLYGRVRSSNVGMLALARRLGFDIDQAPRGATVVVSLDLQRRQLLERTASGSNSRRVRCTGVRHRPSVRT